MLRAPPVLISEKNPVATTATTTILLKSKDYIKHTHCAHLAIAIRGREFGYSTYLKTIYKENKRDLRHQGKRG